MPSFYQRCLLLIALAISTTACYRMPRDDDYSVIPTTNNRDVTHERRDIFLPNVSY